WYLPNVLEVIGRTFAQKPALQVFCGQQFIQHADGNTILSPASPIAKHLERTLSLTHINQPATFFHLPSLRTLLPLREDFHYVFDAEIWLRFLIKFSQKKIHFNKLIINVFSIHQYSKTYQKIAEFDREKFYLLRALALICDTYDLMPKHTLSQSNLEEELRITFEELGAKSLNRKRLKKQLLHRCFRERFGARDFQYCRSILKEIGLFQLGNWRFNLQKLSLLLPNGWLLKIAPAYHKKR
ncbi:MAG: hypothetical protein AAGG68_17115, partial [Bacteroidota bacterium]